MQGIQKIIDKFEYRSGQGAELFVFLTAIFITTDGTRTIRVYVEYGLGKERGILFPISRPLEHALRKQKEYTAFALTLLMENPKQIVYPAWISNFAIFNGLSSWHNSLYTYHPD